jgi:hypothetical protein
VYPQKIAVTETSVKMCTLLESNVIEETQQQLENYGVPIRRIFNIYCSPFEGNPAYPLPPNQFPTLKIYRCC